MELQGEKGPLFPLTSVRKIAPTAGLSPVERAMALQGEEGQARIFSRPPRPEKSALGHFPPVEPMLALQGEEGQARIFSRPPGREKSALGTLSRPPGREKSALGHFPPVEPMLALQGEEGQARIFSRPPRPEKSALGHFPPVEPMLALQGEEGQARIFSRPPRPEKSALGHFPPVEPMLALQGEEGQARIFSRPPRPEKSALGHFPPVEPMLALQGEEGQARIFSRPPRPEKSALGHFPPVEPMLALQGREGQARIFSRPSGRERVPAADFSRPPPREKSALGTLSRPPPREKSALGHSSPCTANVAKNFQSPKSKKKKSSHKVTLVRKLSSRATFLSHRQDKVRAGPYPGFFLSKNLHMQIGLGTKRRVFRRRIFWSQGIYHVTKGQAWACILEFGTPPGSGIWTLLELFPSPVRAQNFSPPALKLPPGYPSEALPERVRNRPFERLWRTRVPCARRHIWREDSPSGELGGARVSLHKLSREPLHVSRNVEFSPLPTPPGMRTP